MAPTSGPLPAKKARAAGLRHSDRPLAVAADHGVHQAVSRADAASRVAPLAMMRIASSNRRDRDGAAAARQALVPP